MHWNESFVITNISNCPRANCNSHLFSETNLLERDCAWIKEANLWFLLSKMAQGNVQLLIVCITLNKKMVIVSWATKFKKNPSFTFPLRLFRIDFSKMNLRSIDWIYCNIKANPNWNIRWCKLFHMLYTSLQSYMNLDFKRLRLILIWIIVWAYCFHIRNWRFSWLDLQEQHCYKTIIAPDLRMFILKYVLVV